MTSMTVAIPSIPPDHLALPGESHKFSITPMTPFRLRRLIVQPEGANDFAIIDINFGKKNHQLHSPGAIPASLFTLANHLGNLDFDELGPNEPISIEVTNKSPRASHFDFRLFGEVSPKEKEDSGIIPKRTIHGLGYTHVPAWSSMEISIQPARHFKADALLIPPEYGEHFDITNIQVQIRPGQQIPATVFQAPLILNVCQASVILKIAVKNRSHEAQIFCGAFVGSYL